MPVLFVGHGAPMLLEDEPWLGELAAWGRALPRPAAILVVSAHWEARPVTLGATRTVPLVYDFYGFPERFYRIRYPAPGAPGLAARVHELLAAAGIPSADDPERGLDHGVYVPLIPMFPRADVPVLQASMPSLDPAELLAVGRALAPLRDEGVLIVGSGFLTHNLRAGFQATTPAWAAEFDAWVADAIARRDVEALVDVERRAPAVRQAHPRTEHLVPLHLALGAAGDDAPAFPITGWFGGGFSKRSVQWG
jgi:4,5-DOPA dioxygenase extradiol